MARNSLSPGFLKIFYTSNTHPHLQVLPVNPVAPAGAGTNLLDKSGASQLWTSAVADIVLFLKQYLDSASTIVSAEVWTQATPTSVPIFQATTALGVAGTAVGAAVPWAQVRQSFRAANGSRAVYQVMESVLAVDLKVSAPLYGGAAMLQASANYLTGSSSVVWSRDNSYLANGIRAVTKTNDKLRKKYLVP